MGKIEDLTAADEAERAAIQELADEQATFLADVAAALADADEEKLAEIAASMNTRADQLRTLAQGQRDADPAIVASTGEASTVDPAQTGH